jgi:hypothetical protein
MAKNQNTYAKRKREMDKKMKAEDKRARRKKRKTEGPPPASGGQSIQSMFDEPV